MSVRGVWQLRRLLLSYCDWGGSSGGARDFIETALPKFQAANPQLEVETYVRRGHHPLLHGFYLNGNERVVGVRNESPAQILLRAHRLRDTIGARVQRVKPRHVTEQRSVQGTWSDELQKELSKPLVQQE